MTYQHPITPPPELIKKWIAESNHNEPLFPQVAIRAAQWGADRQHFISRDFLHSRGFNTSFLEDFDAASLTKPPSKKEQALGALDRIDAYAVSLLTSHTIHDDLVEDVDFLRQLLQGINDG